MDYYNNLKDNDFYSDKLKHLYITGFINSSKIDKLIEDIRNANIQENPKPILIHISSLGGILEDGLKLLSIFKISKVPIATIVDNYCFSIATILLINSPYRIMTKYGFCLLHEYRISGYINDGRHTILNYINKIDTYFKSIITLYLNKTKFKKDELYELLEHNLLLDYKYCLKKGIVNRIIDIEYTKKNKIKENINSLLSNINVNNINITCNILNEEIDNKINLIKENYPTIIYTYCNKINKNNNKDENKNNNKDENKDENKNDNDDNDNDDNNIKNSMILIFNSLNLITKIKIIKTYKYSIIDIPISIENLLPLLYTNKIIMYSHSYIICNLLYAFHNYSLLLEDNIINTKMILKKIKEILKKKTKMPKNYIDNIDKKFIIIDAKQAMKFGLCHQIIIT